MERHNEKHFVCGYTFYGFTEDCSGCHGGEFQKSVQGRLLRPLYWCEARRRAHCRLPWPAPVQTKPRVRQGIGTGGSLLAGLPEILPQREAWRRSVARLPEQASQTASPRLRQSHRRLGAPVNP